MFLGFGEVMMRIAPAGHRRLAQVLPGSVDVTFAGAEANCCVSLSLLGAQARYLTMLPKNMLGDAVVTTLRGLGVDTSSVAPPRRRPARRLLRRNRGQPARLDRHLRPRLQRHLARRPGGIQARHSLRRHPLGPRHRHHAVAERDGLRRDARRRARSEAPRLHRFVRSQLSQEALALATRHEAESARPRVHDRSAQERRPA